MATENTLALGPTGRLRLEVQADAATLIADDQCVQNLREALSCSNAAGLACLATSSWPAELPATVAYWRNWVRCFFRSVCQTAGIPGESWRTIPVPADEELAALVASAPPMVGLEYVTVSLLQQSWQELCGYVADAAMADAEGPLSWLRRVNPLAHLVGKVTFHLAENKRDDNHPFAFLATYAHQLSARAKPQHRPLAEALKRSVAENDRDQLERLLLSRLTAALLPHH